MKNIAEIASGKQAAIDKAYGEGIHVAGERFVVAKIDDGSVYARKVCSWTTRKHYQNYMEGT